MQKYVAHFKTILSNGHTAVQTRRVLVGTKDLKDFDLASNSYSADFLEFRYKLNGKIQYTHPEILKNCSTKQNFEAFVKFFKDPKIEKATVENLASKGSILKSGLMIGLALYIGDECGNSIHQTWTDQIFQPFGRFRLSLLEYWIQRLTIYSTVIYVFLVVSTR
jgi:hypothetical protein